jgi:hypothetical protein
MKLKNQKGVSNGKDILMDDAMTDEQIRPYLSKPEDFTVMSGSEAASSTVDVHGIERTGLRGGHSAYSARPNYIEPPATPLSRTRPPKKSKG